MEHQGIQPHHNTDDQRQNKQQHGIGRNIRPSTAVPPTVLVADMGDGPLFLQGRRDGPSAYLSLADAVALRQELTADFVSTDRTPSSDQSEAL